MSSTRRAAALHDFTPAAIAPVKLFFFVQLFAIVVLQKFALPTPFGPAELSLPVILASLIALMVLGTPFRVEPLRLILLATFWIVATISLVISGNAFASSAIILLFLLYLPACISITVDRQTYLQFMRAFVNMMVFFLGVVIVQHLLQLAFGPEIWPNLDKIVPEPFLFPGYNYIQFIAWGSQYYKPHAFLFLEVSTLSQFAALAFIIEFVFFRRLLFLAALVLLLMLCFAGTGLLILAICLPFLLARTGPRMIITAATGGILFVAVAIYSGWFAQIQDRIFEFNRFGTSGYYRFTVPVQVMRDLLNDPGALFMGHGAGNVPAEDASVYLPLVKLTYEYGFLAMFVFLAFLLVSIFQYTPSKRVAIGFLVFFMICGGGLASPVYALMLVLFCTLFRVSPDKPLATAEAGPVLQPVPPRLVDDIRPARPPAAAAAAAASRLAHMPSRFIASVIIPTYNEERHIGDVLDRVLANANDAIVEVLVVDGRSEDRTREIVEEYAHRDPRVRLIDNPARLQAPGVNLAVKQADPRANVIIRLDAHSDYTDDFMARLLNTLSATGAESVVVRLKTVGSSCFQRAVAAVSNTIFGTGGAIHRVGGKSGFVDHGHHAAFLRSAYSRIDGYDETFAAAEDADFDQRLRDVGGRIWFEASLEVEYFPRPNVRALARQYFRNGIGRAQAVLKHRGKIRLRQAIPPLALLLIAFGVVVAPIYPWALIVPFGYFAGCAAAAIAVAIRGRDPCLLAAAYALPAMHLPWAAGFLQTVLLSVIGRR